jgi:ABC-2 type transport system ATP-binding protein
VFLSSHLLHEVELVCNRAAILVRGRMVVQGPVSQLRPTSNRVKVLTNDQGRAAEILSHLVSADKITIEEDYLFVETPQGSIPEMVRRLVAERVEVQAVVPANEQGLEDMFLELTASEEPSEKRRRS